MKPPLGNGDGPGDPGRAELRVFLPSPRGFCAGVEMAIGSLERALDRFGSPLYAYHEIVHNTSVVESFRSRGVHFVDDLASVPMGASVVFSAHGVAPSVRAEAEARQLTVVDTTCPLVSKVHSEAKRFAEKGYTVVFVGHHGHDEAVGVVGEAPDSTALVESLEDIAALRVPDPNRVVVLTQTTLGVSDTAELIDALRARFPHLETPPKQDICYATENRQRAVAATASDSDVVLVVGSRNSSNSNRLVEEARRTCAKAFLIDGVGDIDPEWLSGATTVTVTAGASVPEFLVEEVLAWLGERWDISIVERTTVVEDVTFRLPVLVR